MKIKNLNPGGHESDQDFLNLQMEIMEKLQKLESKHRDLPAGYFHQNLALSLVNTVGSYMTTIIEVTHNDNPIAINAVANRRKEYMSELSNVLFQTKDVFR